jgi:hypothetical protein
MPNLSQITAINAPASDLPDIGLGSKEVRDWLRHASPEDELPCSFNDLVSIATHEGGRPYINRTGGWPSIITTWIPYAWENGHRDAAIQLITCALYNTNAAADQVLWPEIIHCSSPSARAAWDKAMPFILRSGFFDIGKKNTLFSKNFAALISDTSYWFTPELIAKWTDSEVLGIATDDKTQARMVGRIVASWLAPETTQGHRLASWCEYYQHIVIAEPNRVSGVILSLAVASEHLSSASMAPIYNALHSTDAYRLIEYMTSIEMDRPYQSVMESSLHYAAAYSAMAKQPFAFAINRLNRTQDKSFLPLRQPEIWSKLDTKTKKSMGCLALSTLSKNDPSWRDWFSSIALDAGLPLEMPMLLDLMQGNPGDFSWPQLVAIHAPYTAAILPDLEIGL